MWEKMASWEQLMVWCTWLRGTHGIFLIWDVLVMMHTREQCKNGESLKERCWGAEIEKACSWKGNVQCDFGHGFSHSEEFSRAILELKNFIREHFFLFLGGEFWSLRVCNKVAHALGVRGSLCPRETHLAWNGTNNLYWGVGDQWFSVHLSVIENPFSSEKNKTKRIRNRLL